MFESLAGKCLLASPFLEDPHFFRTIVLVLQHTESECFGLILNRPTEFRLEKVVSMICELECVHDAPLYYGGPVDGPLIALHNSSTVGGHRCNDDLYVTSDQDELKKLFMEKEAGLKLFDGFSGWGTGQLESEVKTGSWLISDITSEQILHPVDLWESMVKQLGDSILQEGGLDRLPADPNWN
jgi:putative transcriptional regulator